MHYGALMTGSGSCVFGLFDNKENAKLAYKEMRTKYETYICITYNSKKENVI